MTNDRLNLDPQRAMAAARDLASAGKQMKQQRTSKGGEIAAKSEARPWGKDDIGAAFEKTYRNFETQMLKSWEGLAGYVEGLGSAVGQAVSDVVPASKMPSGRIEGSAKLAMKTGAEERSRKSATQPPSRVHSSSASASKRLPPVA